MAAEPVRGISNGSDVESAESAPPSGDVRIVLASGSPRRKELLEQLGFALEIRPSDIDESVLPGEDPHTYVRRLATEKAKASARPGDLVIAADTTVAVDGQIIGKPDDREHARTILEMLSGRTHDVYTGFAVAHESRLYSEVVTTQVTFSALTAFEIEWYLETGEPFDKAGAYGLQGKGGAFVKSVSGSVTNVIGLPVSELLVALQSFGMSLSPKR